MSSASKGDRTETAWSEERRRALPKVEYRDNEMGVVQSTTPAAVAAAAGLVSQGKIYDLDAGRWPGMPLFAGHPQFSVTTYRNAQGFRIQHDLDDWLGENRVETAFTSELIIGTMHTGTHLDGLCHTTCGHDSEWYGGYRSAEALGNFGPTRAEASSIAPFVCRGLLLDAAGARGVDALDGCHPIDLDDMERTLARAGKQVRPGDAVLFRTGYMKYWAVDPEKAAAHHGAGITLEVAQALADAGVCLVGSDTETVEREPSLDPYNPQPVHIELLIRRGVHLLELAHLEDLARDGVSEFMFVCLPLRIRGATGSMVRPMAIV